METLLVSVTAISLLLATGLTFVAWKLLSDNRARSAARAEMLASIAEAEELQYEALSIDGVDVPQDAASPDARDEAVYAREVAGEAGYDVFRAAAPARTTAPARTAPPAPAKPARPAAPPAAPTPGDLLFRNIRSTEDDEMDLMDGPSVSPLFAGASHSGASRWVALAIAVAIVVLGAGSVLAFRPASEMLASLKHDPNADQPKSPLALLSLRNATDGGGFTVTGLVQNPTGAPVLKNVVAVVYLFDRDGKYFASGKAPLESISLQPGEESPFVVKIAASGVSRYRVGFRTTDGTVIAHVDHRGDMPADGTGVDVTAGRPSVQVLPAPRREGTHGN
jgi:hypothetical protein